MASRKLKLQRAVNRLAKYNGLATVKDLAGDAQYRSVVGLNLSSGDSSLDQLLATRMESAIIDLFIDTSEGALPTYQLIESLRDIVSGNENVKRDLNKIFQVYYTRELQGPLFPGETPPSVLDALGYSDGAEASIINSFPRNPSKSSPGLGIILSNSHRVGLTERDANPSVLFLNSIPTIEMAKAVPFVDVQLSFGRPAKNQQTGQIQTMSLPKFLVGAKNATAGSSLDTMVSANQILPGEPRDAEGNILWSEARATAGMELFTSPQTLVNANETDNQTIRSNPVIDKFRPFMTIQDFEVTIVPSGGLMSYKSATLSLVLHDRSRLAEIADFVRADLYGTTELLIEYGWCHPDSEFNPNNTNVYADLINGMRIKEKYSIVNSSFNLTDSGEIAIKLSLFTRGMESFVTELISSDSGNVGNAIRDIENLQREIAELRSRIYGDGSGTTTREIRGVQILDAAQDALNHTAFSSELRDAMRDFRRQLTTSGNPNLRTLINNLEQMYGTVSGRGNTARASGNTSGGTETYLTRLRRSVQDSVREKMIKLSASEDPFLRSSTEAPVGRRKVEDGNIPRATLQRIRDENAVQGVQPGSVSLAKLLTLFVAEPLANTGKFDDIQMVFYPFNAYAGAASRINIGNFAVDTEFFASNFARWRLERIGRSANVNLNDFVNFLRTTILDDPAASSYGLILNGKSLFKQVPTNSNGTQAMGLEAIAEPADHITQVEQALRGITPDGSFRMPQIDIFLEGMPEKLGTQDGVVDNQIPEKTILKIHVFDRLATTYDTLGSLMANTRNTEIAAIGSTASAPPIRENDESTYGNPGVNESRARIHSTFLNSAEAYGIIEPIENTSPVIYRIKGGPRTLKDFLYKTVPYITYGTIGTNIKNANLTSVQDPALNTVNLLRSFRSSELEPNGENPGGLPMRIIPTTLDLSSVGCPLINFAQQYFVDFQTGTTADNIYSVSGLSHKFTQGDYTSGIKFAPMDAYGRYIGIIDQVRNAQRVLEDIDTHNRQQQQGTSSTSDT